MKSLSSLNSNTCSSLYSLVQIFYSSSRKSVVEIISTAMTIFSDYCTYNLNIIHTAATFSTLQRLKQQFHSKKELLPIPLSTPATLDSTYETVYSEDLVDYAYPNHSFVGSTDPSSSHYTPAPSIKTSHKQPLVPHGVAEVEAAIYEVPYSKDPVDYTYPDHSFTTSTDSSSIYHTPAPSPKPSHKQPLLPHGATAIIPSNYEVPNSKDPQDYTYSVSTLKTDSSSNDYACPTSPKSEAATYGLDEDILYHSVGPSIKPPPTGRKGNQSTHPPSLTPNLSPRKSSGQEGFYHSVEESLEDVSALYEDPTLPQFTVLRI